MYIGSTDIRGLHHLVWEVVDNSIDEAMAGLATDIEVHLLPDGSVMTVDNGRGIPVGKQKQTGKDAMEMVHTVLHAGGKFGGGGYKVSGGLHGVGVCVVNALSEWLRVESARDGKLCRQEYERGKPKGPVHLIGNANGRPARPPSSCPTSRSSSDRLRLRDHRPALPRVGLPDQARPHPLSTSASTHPRDELLLRGRHRQLRAPPQQGQGRSQRQAHLHRAARGLHVHRSGDPVQRQLHRERALIRQQHQHHRRRHACHRLPRRADAHAQRLRPQQRHPQGRRRQPHRATTCARA